MHELRLFFALSIVASTLGCDSNAGSNCFDGTFDDELTRCRTGPGITVLYTGIVTGLSGADYTVVATTDSEVVNLPFDGVPQKTLTKLDSPYGALVMKNVAYFAASHPEGPVDEQGKQPTATSLYMMQVTDDTPLLALPEAPLMNTGAAGLDELFFASRQPSAVTEVTFPEHTSTIDIALDGKVTVDSIAVHLSWVYVAAQDLDTADPKSGVIQRFRRVGEPAQRIPERIVTGIGHPSNLVASDAGLFWVEDPPTGTFGEGRIARAKLDGSQVTTLLPHGASALAEKDGYLYFASDVIGKVSTSGGDVTVLADGLSGPKFLTLSLGNAVWVDRFTKALSDTTPMTVMTVCTSGG